MARLKCPRGEQPVALCVPEETPTRFAGLRLKCPTGMKQVLACPTDLRPAEPEREGVQHPQPAPEHYGLGQTLTLKCARGEVPICTPRYAVPGLSGDADEDTEEASSTTYRRLQE